jgi:hypothetical protein
LERPQQSEIRISTEKNYPIVSPDGAASRHGLLRARCAQKLSGAVTAATNKVSHQIFRNQGFVVRVQRSYRAHRFDGREIFASISSEPSDLLLMNDEIRLPAFRTQAKDYPTAACSKMIKGATCSGFT